MSSMNSYCVAVTYYTVLGTWDTLVNKTCKEFAFMELTNE